MKHEHHERKVKASEGILSSKLPSTTRQCDNATEETVLRMGWYGVTCRIHALMHAGTRIAAFKMNALQHCSAMDAQHMQSRQWIQTDRSDSKKHMIYSTLYIICKWYRCKQQKSLQSKVVAKRKQENKVFQKLNIWNNTSIISVPLSLQSFKLLAPRANRLPWTLLAAKTSARIVSMSETTTFAPRTACHQKTLLVE